MIAILGATNAEARYWAAIYAAGNPDLKEAIPISAFSREGIYEGMRIQKLYVAPGACEGRNYPEILSVLQRNLLRTPGSVDPIYLGEK